jgi:hypothetical protein
MNEKVVKNVKALNKIQIKRVLAILMAVLMVVSAIDFSGTQYVSAADESMANVITAFAELPEETANQQLAVSALETEINLPASLSVTSEIYHIDTTQTVTGGAISVSGAAITVNPSYNLTGVVWKIDAGQSSSASFDSSVGNTHYIYIPELPATDSEGNTIQLADGVSLPQIRVEIVATDDNVVRVTTGGTTTPYKSFAEALTAIQGEATAQLQLLSAATSDDFTITSGKSITIDLNGKTLTCNKITVDNGAVLTMNDSSGNNSGALNGAIFTDGELNITGGTYLYTGPKNLGNYYYATIYANTNSTGTITGGLFKRNGSDNAYVALEYSQASRLKLHGGTFDMIDGIKFNTADKLPIGYCLQNAEGSSLDYPTGQRCFNVTAVKCVNHQYSGATCRYCRSENPNYIGVAQVTIAGVTTNYDDLPAALSAANGNTATITLMEDVFCDNQNLTSGRITLDLNGHKIENGNRSIVIVQGADVTIKNGTIKHTDRNAAITVNSGTLLLQSDVNISSYSNYNCGLIIFGGIVMIDGASFINGDISIYIFDGDLTINDGQFNGRVSIQGGTVSQKGGTYAKVDIEGDDTRCVSDLLAEDCAYRSNGGDGAWYGYTGDKTISNVTVQPIPVQITDHPQVGASATYGYTSDQAPALSVTAVTTDAAPTGSELSYQWYRVKSGSETNDMAVGTNSSTLTIPTGLDTGTHSFYCAVSCDGYIVNSQSAEVTVGKTTPTVTLRVITREDAPFIYGNGVYLHAWVTGVDGEKPDGTVTFKDGDHVLATSNFDSFSESYSAGGSQYPNAGNHNFTAVYTPSTDGIGKNYVSATSAVVQQAIAKANQDQDTFHFTEVEGLTYGDADVTLEATGGNSTGEVTFSVPANNGVLELYDNNKGRIIGGGTVTVTATKAADDNYNSITKTQEISIARRVTDIRIKSQYSEPRTYTGAALAVPGESDLEIVGAAYRDVTFAWYQGSVAEGNRLNAAPVTPGDYYVVATIEETTNLMGSSCSADVSMYYYNGEVVPAYNDSTTKAGWYAGDVAITAAGFTISDSLEGTYAASYLLSGEGIVTKKFYFKQDGTGDITDGKEITVNIDKTAPVFSDETDGITISNNHWKSFLNTITFGHFFKETKYVSILATDSGSRVDKYYYYLDNSGSTVTKTAGELDALSFTKATGGSFSISDENKYVIYVYVVDAAGNRSAYICTDGIVIDKTAPSIMMYEPGVGDVKDTWAVANTGINEIGTVTYVIKTAEVREVTAQTIFDDPDKKTVSRNGDFPYMNLRFDDLTANTTYYIYGVGTDRAGNNSEVKSTSFTTTKTQPIFADSPAITGTYGQKVKDMIVSQVASTNGALGTWSAISDEVPSVGTTDSYEVVFTPEDAEHCTAVTVQVTPTVHPKSLMTAGVTIGAVSGTYTYDTMEQKPTVTVADSAAAITASDYEYSYSNNTNAGSATVTVTGKGNYTGKVSRTFTIAKAAAPSITYPTAGNITYGQKLSASILTGGSTEYGAFAWTDANTVPTVANSDYEVTFTPNADTEANYEGFDTTGTVSVTVAKATSTVTVNVALSGNAGSRKATLTATITGVSEGEAPIGTVKFVNITSSSDADIEGATAVAITGGKATYTWTGLADQIYKVKAVYNGSDNYNIATSTELEVDTRKQNQSALTIDSIGSKIYGDGSFTLITAGGTGTGTVTFISSEPEIVSISGSTATTHKAGTVTITATKAEDSTYNEVIASLTLTVGKKELTVKADNKSNIIKGAAMPELTYTVTGLVGSDTFTEPTISTTAADTNTVGEYDILISGGTLANTDSYAVSYTGGKLTIINAPVSPGGSSGSGDASNGGSSLTDTPQPDTGTPAIKDASNKEGWEAIKEQISQSMEGDTVTIEMNGSSVISGEVLDTIRGTDTTLVFDMGDGITWSINGLSITDSSLNDVNLDVTLDTEAIPAELIRQMAGEQTSSTLSLAYDGPFGFTSVLTINLNEINAGKYGNLFYYDPETKQLTLQAVGEIGEKGSVELPFDHASDYVVIISEEPMLEKALVQITFNQLQGTLYVGGTEKKSMTLELELPQRLKEVVEKDSTIQKITYQSSNPKVATVTASGMITAKKAGKTTVTTLVTINGIQRKFQTEITVSKAYIKLIKSTNTLKTGSSFTYKAVGYGVKTEDIMFYTSKKSIVVVDKITGKAKARTKGTDYIIAKAGNVKVKIKVKVS